jgi:hypothetical protein
MKSVSHDLVEFEVYFMRKQPLLIFLAITGFFYITGRPIDPTPEPQIAGEAAKGDAAIGEIGGKDGSGMAGKTVKRSYGSPAGQAGGKMISARDESPNEQSAEKERNMAYAAQSGADGGHSGKTAWNSPKQAETKIAALPQSSRDISTPSVRGRKEGRLSPSALRDDRLSTGKRRYSEKTAGWTSRKRRYARKSFDWSVFGNDRRSRSELGAASIERRLHMQREEERRRLRALVSEENLVDERSSQRRKAAERKVRRASSAGSRSASRRKSRVRKKRFRKARRSFRRARRTRMARRSARKRFRSRKVYRVARKHRKRKAKKKWYASLFKPQRRGHFGFVTHAGVTSLINR